MEEIEEAAANLADPNLCKTDNWIAGAKWMLEKLQDFDTWKEWKNKLEGVLTALNIPSELTRPKIFQNFGKLLRSFRIT